MGWKKWTGLVGQWALDRYGQMKKGMGVLFFPGQSGNLGFLVISLVQKQIFKKHTFWQLYTWNDYFLKDVFVLYTVCKRELIAQINQRTSYISKGWNHGGDLKNMYQVPCEDTAGLSSFPNIMFQDDRGVHHTIVHLMLMQPPPSVVLVCSDLETYSRPSVGFRKIGSWLVVGVKSWNVHRPLTRGWRNGGEWWGMVVIKRDCWYMPQRFGQAILIG